RPRRPVRVRFGCRCEDVAVAPADPDQVDSAVGEIVDELRVLADPERAVGEKAYLKSSYDHLGVRVPARRKVATTWLRADGPPRDLDLVRAVAEALWTGNCYERRGAAVDLLEAVSSPPRRRRHRRADQTDGAEETATVLGPDDLGLVERWVRDAHTWALVDPLAHGIAGRILTAAPGAEATWTDRWRADDDFWVRRSSVLCLSRPIRAGVVGFDRFETITAPMLGEREFFIRKAIGWVLREIGRDTPADVATYCDAHVEQMSGVTWREARKVLDPALVATLETRRR
ncbi:MAG: DNA alkylation repair protein, partial [Actinomycetota bacterium]|nr:DNA alkylation repair protein [Actinomycetota bacterium]